MRKIKCLHCGTVFEIQDEDISDNCCSDECWEKIYAPGPKEEEEELADYNLAD
jgi:predicted  nucleic acid-binding Zn-ribbon protein